VEVKLHADVRGLVRVLVCRQGEKSIEAVAEQGQAGEENGQPSVEAQA